MSETKLLDDLRKMRDFCCARHLSGVDCDTVLQRVREVMDGGMHQRALQDAFVAGSQWRVNAGPPPFGNPCVVAADRYPITRTVPRVVTDGFGVEWKYGGGWFWRRTPPAQVWSPADEDPAGVTEARVRLWADLMANPTTTVTE